MSKRYIHDMWDCLVEKVRNYVHTEILKVDYMISITNLNSLELMVVCHKDKHSDNL